jgi:hypothetical protein
LQLILHIGTHKTGTSALQACLRRNERLLEQKNIYYARKTRAKNANLLGRASAKNHRIKIAAFFDQHLSKAQAIGAKTMLVSAEALYAMTMFFHKFNGRTHDYWDCEAHSIKLLRGTLPSSIPIKLVVFFRRQDRFLESIYQQVIMSKPVSMRIGEFARFLAEALDYAAHMKLWSAAFTDCTVFNYDQAAHNVSGFFLRQVLGLENIGEFNELDLRLNTRLNRDVLEFKRLLNATETSPVERRINKLVCTELAQRLTDNTSYHDYLTAEDRLSLLAQMKDINSTLCEQFGMVPFSPPSPAELNRTLYPGLTPRVARELARDLQRIKRTPGYQIERVGLLARRTILRRLSFLSWMLSLGRWVLPRHRRLSELRTRK